MSTGTVFNVFSNPIPGAFRPVHTARDSYHMAVSGVPEGRRTQIHRGTHKNDSSETYINVGPAYSLEVEGKRYLVKNGDIFTIPPNVRHGDFVSPEGYRAVILHGSESGQPGGDPRVPFDSYVPTPKREQRLNRLEHRKLLLNA